MSRAALLIDFGSTYTKLCAVDLDGARILGTGQGPSTVDSDITRGMQAALDALERNLGRLPNFSHRLASSSAAGGLRMVTVGLVPELTAEAARQAALGAGARLVGCFSYRLTRGDIAKILELKPDILLLAGGTDGGNSAVLLHNAQLLGGSPLGCPVLIAGNRAAADEATDLLGARRIVVTENVMPEFNVLNIEPARAAIRRVFIDRIVHAKGIDRAQRMFDQVLMPTPAAVMEGARLLSEGTPSRAGLGPLLVIDPGGATTDVHSVCTGEPSRSGVIPRGLPEPRVKRSVEGDLGMRINAMAVKEAVGIEVLAADAGLAPERVAGLLNEISADVERLPVSTEELALDRALVRAAIRLAALRHAGTVETVFTVTGPVTVQHGKDLGNIETVIGTGGALVHSPDPRSILEVVQADGENPFSLRPRHPKYYLDTQYVLYACGLLSQSEPDIALDLALGHLKPLQ